MRVFPALLPLVLLGCQREAHFDWPTDLPSAQDAPSMLVLVSSARGVSGVGFDRTDDQLPALPVALDFDATITLVLNRAPLSEMGVGDRLVESTSGVGLATWARGFWQTQLEDHRSRGWTPVAAIEQLPSELRAYRFDGQAPPNHCARFKADRVVPLVDTTSTASISVDSRARIDFVISLDQHRFLLNAIPNELWLVDTASRSAERLSRQAVITAGVRGGDQRIYLAGHKLLRLDPSFRSFEPVGTSTRFKNPIVSLAASAPGVPFELFALTSSGALFRSDGVTVEKLLDEAPASELIINSSGLQVVWLAPGEAMMIRATERLYHYRAGATPAMVDEVPADGIVLSALALVPGLGPVVAAYHGRVLARSDSGSWRELLQENDIVEIDTLAPFDQGIFLSGGRGLTGEWMPDAPPCPILSNVVTAGVRVFLELGHSKVLMAGSALQISGDSAPNRVYQLTVQR